MKRKWIACVLLSAASVLRASAQEDGHKRTTGFYGEFASYDMVDADTGWAIGKSGDKTMLLQTRDGGKHWEDITPKAAQPKAEVLSDVEDTLYCYLLDANHGWVAVQDAAAGPGAGVHLFSTGDGGRTWKRSSFRTSVGAIFPMQFPDPRHGFILVESDPASGKTQKATYRTVDGGATWRETSVASYRVDTDGCLPRLGACRGMVFRNATEGWINGEPRGEDEAFFFRTGDGGKHWLPQSFKAPDGFGKTTVNVGTPRFFGDRKVDGVVGVRFRQYDPTPEKVAYMLYRTRNGGNQWSPMGPVPEDADDAIPFFIDADRGWLLSDDVLFATIDGGAKWQEVETNLHFGDNESAEQLSFATPSIGRLVLNVFDDRSGNHYILLQTADGGHTWTH